MRVVVVGGSSRNVGKTAVVAALIAGLRNLEWVGVKITPHAHGKWTGGEGFRYEQDFELGSGTDTSRYLNAGAERAYLLTVRDGWMGEAMAALEQVTCRPEFLVIESNSALEFLRPDVALFVMDASVEDLKESATRYLDRMDAVVWVGDGGGSEGSAEARRRLEGLRQFRVTAPEFSSELLLEYVAGIVTE